MTVKDEVKSFILKTGDKYIVYRGSNIRTYDHLPLGIYRTNVDPFGNITLSVSEDFLVPEKIYGTIKARAERILNTYEQREQSTGVLLSGEKGSGKTMLVKHLSMEALKKGYSTIIADQAAVASDGFIPFMESLAEPAVVVMDEFEKMFNSNNDQSHLLSLFDGVSQGKKLYLLTANDDTRVNDYFKARPGRLFYNFRYTKLEREIVEEVIVDYGLPDEFADQLLDYVEACDTFNFDSLMAIVEEWKRYRMGFEETVEGLNITQKPNYYWEESYDFSVYFEGAKKPLVVAVDQKINLNNGTHMVFSDTTYELMSANPENDPVDLSRFVEIMTNGRAKTREELKAYFEKEDYEMFYLSRKGLVGRTGNQQRIRDLSNTQRPVVYILEKKETINPLYAW